jgi:hypothetical protein
VGPQRLRRPLGIFIPCAYSPYTSGYLTCDAPKSAPCILCRARDSILPFYLPRSRSLTETLAFFPVPPQLDPLQSPLPSFSSVLHAPERHRHHLAVAPSPWSTSSRPKTANSSAVPYLFSTTSPTSRDAFKPLNCRRLPHGSPSKFGACSDPRPLRPCPRTPCETLLLFPSLLVKISLRSSGSVMTVFSMNELELARRFPIVFCVPCSAALPRKPALFAADPLR